jgi:hypothetical protein
MAEDSGRDEVAGKCRPSIPRLLRRALTALVLLVLLAYGLSNLWLMSPWGKGMVAKKLSARTGFDWEVGSMSWSPWNGCSMGDVRMLQPGELREVLPEPVVNIERIRVRPYWIRMLRGQGMRPREVLIDSPRLNLSLELMAALTGAEVRDEDLPEQPRPEVPMELAAIPVEPGPVNLPQAGGPTQPGAEVPPQDPAQDLPQDPSAPQPPLVALPAPPEVERSPAGPPTRLLVRNASLRLVSLGKQLELLRLDGASMDLPVYGEDAAGKITVASLLVRGFPELRDLEQELVWKRPCLWIEETALDPGGVKLRFAAQLAMGRHPGARHPFLVDMVMDPQQVQSVEGLEHVGLQVAAGTLVGRFRLLGLLRQPTSWQGRMLVLGERVSVKRGQGQEVLFDELRLPAILHMGKLYWANVKLLGEDLSVLGNGRISMRGGSMLAVTRLVASPELAVELTKSLQRAKITQGMWWHDLGTPDRVARDLTISGSLYNPEVDAGDHYSKVPLERLVGPIFSAVSPEPTSPEARTVIPVPGAEPAQGENRFQ